MSYAARDIERDWAKLNLEKAASIYFKAADQYRMEGQSDKAREIYKEIVTTFSGPAWAGYRDRARMEFDELRPAQKRQTQ